MSYINKHEQKLIKRRAEVVRKPSYAELLVRLDSQAEEANKLIAKSESKAQHWFDVANEAEAENEGLRKQIAALESRVAELEAENARLLRRATRRQGKRKGQEWEVDE